MVKYKERLEEQKDFKWSLRSRRIPGYWNKMTSGDDWNRNAGAGNGPNEIFKGLILWH